MVQVYVQSCSRLKVKIDDRPLKQPAQLITFYMPTKRQRHAQRANNCAIITYSTAEISYVRFIFANQWQYLRMDRLQQKSTYLADLNTLPRAHMFVKLMILKGYKEIKLTIVVHPMWRFGTARMETHENQCSSALVHLAISASLEHDRLEKTS